MVGGLSIEGCLSTPALCDGGVHRRRLFAPKAPFFIPERGGIVNNRRRSNERITAGTPLRRRATPNCSGFHAFPVSTSGDSMSW